MTASRAQQADDVDVPREFWTVREFAVSLGLNQHTVNRMCNHGQIGWIPIGRQKRIPNSELERLRAEALARRSA